MDKLHILLVGDFNAPDAIFSESKQNDSRFSAQLSKVIIEAGLIENVNQDTRWAASGKASKLDLVFTNCDQLVGNLKIGPPLGRSDHAMNTFDYYSQRIEPPSHSQAIRNFYKTDYATLNRMLDCTNWTSELDFQSTNDMWT